MSGPGRYNFMAVSCVADICKTTMDHVINHSLLIIEMSSKHLMAAVLNKM